MKALHFRRWVCALCVGSAWAVGAAETPTIYRCGTRYSDTPCAQAVAVPTADPRSPAQKAQTDAATSRAAMLAGQLEKARHSDEAAARQQALAPAVKEAPKPSTAGTPDKAHPPKKHKRTAVAAAEKLRRPVLEKPQKPLGFTIKVPAPKK